MNLRKNKNKNSGNNVKNQYSPEIGSIIKYVTIYGIKQVSINLILIYF